MYKAMAFESVGRGAVFVSVLYLEVDERVATTDLDLAALLLPRDIAWLLLWIFLDGLFMEFLDGIVDQNKNFAVRCEMRR